MTQSPPWSIELKRIDGQQESLASYQGKVLLVLMSLVNAVLRRNMQVCKHYISVLLIAVWPS